MSKPDSLELIDPNYFRRNRSWSARLSDWMAAQGGATQDEFFHANERTIAFTSRSGNAFEVVFNVSAATLETFLTEGVYKNQYELKAKIGGTGFHEVDEIRRTVDQAVFPQGDKEKEDDYEERVANRYFGALALTGCGVRYYGEFCLVLKSDRIDPQTQIMDRNSWYILFPPLKGCASLKKIAARLVGVWQSDSLPIVKLKVLPQLNSAPRLATTGIVGNAVLNDESFVEVHKAGKIKPADVHEVRESPSDSAVESRMLERKRDGYVPSLEEKLWLGHRRRASAELEKHGISLRVVPSNGRLKG